MAARADVSGRLPSRLRPTKRARRNAAARARPNGCRATLTVRRLRCDATPAGIRDTALLAVLFGAGLRRSELVALNVDDYDAARAALAVRSGKGRKQRMVYVAPGGAAAMAAWLRIRGDEGGALFCPSTKVGACRAGRCRLMRSCSFCDGARCERESPGSRRRRA